MTRRFNDHFSIGAESYARYRPDYPASLFEWIGGAAAERDCVWDCATGAGQAAVGLAAVFERVIATDGSRAQIANARRLGGVHYAITLAESSCLRDRSVAVVTVAQALHWLDRPGFYAEVRRVLRPGGLIAIWCYGLLTVSDAIDPIIRDLYDTKLGSWWAQGRNLVDELYRSIEFPFQRVPTPALEMTADWTLTDLEGYLRTWSAFLKYRSETKLDAVAAIHEDLARAWGKPDARRRVRWPLGITAGTWTGETAGAVGS